MGIVPNTQQGAIDFFANRLPTWGANAIKIGLSAEQVTQIATDVSDASDKLAAAQAARIAAKNATLELALAMDTMRSFGGDLVKTIRTYAETTGDNEVYTLSDVPPIAPPTPVGAPATPTDLTAVINNFGEIKTEWKGSRAAGTQFILQRQMKAVDGTLGEWTYAGSSTTNDYTDNAVPTGFAAVSYRVYAQRPGGTSDASGTTTLNFGIGGSQAVSASGNTDLTIAA